MIGVEEGAVLGERRGRESEGGASFLAMQVLEIPARGRGFPLVCLNAIIIYNSKHAKTIQALTEPWGMVSLKTLNKYLSNDIALLQDGQSMYWCLLLGFCLKHEYHVRWIIRGYKKKRISMPDLEHI